MFSLAFLLGPFFVLFVLFVSSWFKSFFLPNTPCYNPATVRRLAGESWGWAYGG
jgi:hypothetical protein